VGANEVGANEVGANEVGANEVGANEVGANEVGANEVGANEVGRQLTSGEHKALYLAFLDRLGWQGAVKDMAEEGLMLTAKTITSLSELLPMDYAQVERLILHIGLQMQVLSEQQQGICGFTLDDIIVLDEEYFFLSGLDHVINIKNNNKNNEPMLAFTYPLKFTKAAKELLAPELREKLVAKVLPFTTNVNVGYYSLAKLCLVCLALEQPMESLRGSKMYYCLERCLRVAPEERVFLYF